jgi:V/A-type H+/Na+-transporting ATPase subunit K
MEYLAFILAAVVLLAPLALLAQQARKVGPGAGRHGQWVRGVVRGLFALNGVILLVALLLGARLLFSPAVSAAPVLQGTATTGGLNGLVALAAALSTGLACVGAGIAVGMTGSAALGTIAERPETFGRAIIFVGLAEGIAIYGLIISFLIISR